MSSEKQKLNTVMRLGVELTEVKDVDVLLERILLEARQLTNADAGSIYIKEIDKLKFSYTQNDTQQKKLSPGKKLIYEHSPSPSTTRRSRAMLLTRVKLSTFPMLTGSRPDFPIRSAGHTTTSRDTERSPC